MISGIGVWIEKLEKADRADIEHIVHNAVATGCSWIAVHCGYAYNSPIWDEKCKEFSRRCKEAEIKLFTWNTSKPATWTQQVHLVKNQFDCGVDGHIVRPTVEWHGRAQDASAFMKQIRSLVGTGFYLGVVVSHNHKAHSQFPYQQFSKDADFLCAEMDWMKHGEKFEKCSELFDSNVKYIQSTFLKEEKPIVPVCLSSASHEDFEAFIEKNYALGSFSYWETTGEDKFMKLAAIALKYDMDDEAVEELEAANTEAEIESMANEIISKESVELEEI